MSFTPPCPGTYGAGPLLVQAPVVKPWGYGLLSVATVIDEQDAHARNGIVYKSPPCDADVQPWDDNCDPLLRVIKSATDSEQNAVVRGCPFHLYAALDCKTTTLEAMGPYVAEVFAIGEQRAVETQVWERVLAQPETVALNGVGTEFTVVGGIGALESAHAQCYGGQATIHGDRGLASFAMRDHLLVRNAGHLETVLGTNIAFYGGSPNTSPAGVPAAPGFAWVYITSDLTLRRFPVDILPETDQRLRWNPLTNEPYVLAERTYVPSIECCAFAVLVCLGCE